MRRISSLTAFFLSATHSYKNPISILHFFFFFCAPPREPSKSKTNVTRIYYNILVQRHEQFLLLLLFAMYTNGTVIRNTRAIDDPHGKHERDVYNTRRFNNNSRQFFFTDELNNWLTEYNKLYMLPLGL